jgi:O-acetyl-ADP-ribose deacetylase (regulator of RNase III)
VVTGDITTMQFDAIVNAANEGLFGGGGVDGAIHRAAGPDLLEECLTLGGCKTGEAKLTRGYRLHARHIIHTVGPVWGGGVYDEDADLASCYRRSLALANQHGVRTIAFPAISTGVYGFPRERAARIAVREIRAFLAQHDVPEAVRLVAFTDSDALVLQRAVSDCPPRHTEPGRG